VLIVERNFAELSGEIAATTSGSVTSPVSGLGGMVRRRWKDPAPSAVQTQEPKTKVSTRLKATVGLMKMEAGEFAI
jgi:predicted nucleic acid-binding Zn ribbon protein